jgi:type VI secretion system secreted protein Hcp
MAVNAYLIIKGRPGPSISKKDAIDILSFSFGVSQANVIGAGSSGAESTAGRANLTDISIMKVTDKLTPDLFLDCASGTVHDEVDIIYDKPVGVSNAQQDYFKIHMEKAFITSMQVSGSSENPTESLSFAYSKIKISYNPEESGVMKGFINKGFDALKFKKW